MVKGQPKKVPWVPEFLRNSPRARIGLGVLVEPGQEPDLVEWRALWEERVKALWEEDEAPRQIDLVQTWEELEGGAYLVSSPGDLLDLLGAKAAPGLWLNLLRALQGDKKAKEKLLAKFLPEEPVSLEEQRKELEEASLNDLASSVADPSPLARVKLGL